MGKKHSPEIIVILKDFFRDVSQYPDNAQKEYLGEQTGLTNRQLRDWFSGKRAQLKKNRIQTRNALLMLKNNISSVFVASKQNEAACLIDKLMNQISEIPKNTAKAINPKIRKDMFKDDEKSLEEALELCDELIGSSEDDGFEEEEEAYVLLSDEQGPEFCAPLFLQNAMEHILKQRKQTYELFKKQNCRKLY